MSIIKHMEIRNLKEELMKNRSLNNYPCSSGDYLAHSTLKTTEKLTLSMCPQRLKREPRPLDYPTSPHWLTPDPFSPDSKPNRLLMGHQGQSWANLLAQQSSVFSLSCFCVLFPSSAPCSWALSVPGGDSLLLLEQKYLISINLPELVSHRVICISSLISD